MSYSALEAASNQLARALIDGGLQKQQRVGIFMRKGLDLGVAIYGVLKAGGIFVPLDPFLPLERLAFIIEDCQIEHLLSSMQMQKQLAGLDKKRPLRIYGIDEQTGFRSVSWDQIGAFPSAPPDIQMIDQDLAYIMYTSGSTGSPKGMMHTHHGSISYARWGALHVGLTPADRVASHAPLHFDLSIFDFFSTAQSGGCVVLVPEAVTKFPASWTQYIESERISVVFTVPYTLIEMLTRGVMHERDLSSLRWVLFGGEPFPPKHLRELMQMLPGVRFTNVYGPAEAPSCTCYDVPTLPDDYDEPIPIGTVSLNSEDLIVNEDGSDCGVDEEGELCIRSSTLTKGYWNRDDLNAEAFLCKDSFGPFPIVYYRTGDMVVRRADGLLRFLGRKDRMVKTRGYRVELDEVEAALVSFPTVSEAAAFTIPDGKGSLAILASVSLHSGQEGDCAAIMQHARAKIPAYALPQGLQVIEEFPRTSSGKIDRKQLAADHSTTAD